MQNRPVSTCNPPNTMHVSSMMNPPAMFAYIRVRHCRNVRAKAQIMKNIKCARALDVFHDLCLCPDVAAVPDSDVREHRRWVHHAAHVHCVWGITSRDWAVLHPGQSILRKSK